MQWTGLFEKSTSLGCRHPQSLRWAGINSVGDHVGLSLHVSYVSGVFGQAAQLVGLPQSLRVCFCVDGGNKGLVVCVKREASTFDPGTNVCIP